MFEEFYYRVAPNLFSYIILYMIILYTIMLFSIWYRKYLSKKELRQNKRDTINFCINDTLNYEELIGRFISSGIGNYNNNNEGRITELLSILMNFDKISIAVHNEVFDKDIIMSYYGKYFVQFYKEFKYFILTRRTETKNPYLFIEYEKLAINWGSEYEYDYKKETRYNGRDNIE